MDHHSPGPGGQGPQRHRPGRAPLQRPRPGQRLGRRLQAADLADASTPPTPSTARQPTATSQDPPASPGPSPEHPGPTSRPHRAAAGRGPCRPGRRPHRPGAGHRRPRLCGQLRGHPRLRGRDRRLPRRAGLVGAAAGRQLHHRRIAWSSCGGICAARAGASPGMPGPWSAAPPPSRSPSTWPMPPTGSAPSCSPPSPRSRCWGRWSC